MATYSNILAWRIPWTVEPGGLHSVRLQRIGLDYATNTFIFFFTFSQSNTTVISMCLVIFTQTTGSFSKHIGQLRPWIRRIKEAKGVTDYLVPIMWLVNELGWLSNELSLHPRNVILWMGSCCLEQLSLKTRPAGLRTCLHPQSWHTHKRKLQNWKKKKKIHSARGNRLITLPAWSPWSTLSLPCGVFFPYFYKEQDFQFRVLRRYLKFKLLLEVL